MSDQPEVLWTPPEERRRGSRLWRFMQRASERSGRELGSYEELWSWSVEELEPFWSLAWDELDPVVSTPPLCVIESPESMPGARFFPGAELNFAENLLRPVPGPDGAHDGEREAIVFHGERGDVRRITRRELRSLVARAARGLREAGVGRDDRVAGFMPNLPETIVSMLAATSLGATWTSCSPDFGQQGVLDRFGQVEPKVLVAADGYSYGGKAFDSLGRLAEVAAKLPKTERIVVVPYLGEGAERPERAAGLDHSRVPGAISWSDFLGADDDPELVFEQVPFDHPLYVMYSSGTTGLPKCMVQGVGGILLQHLKEHRLHVDLGPEDRVFYFTTCGWMMWNWLVSALGSGSTVVLFDGAAFHPDPLALWRMAERERLSVFGTSARYLAALEKSGQRPAENCDLGALRSILSTGSPLPPEGFRHVYRDVKEDVQLASISGGTDLNGCFALGNPLDPVVAGELQCRGLGMKVFAYDSSGRPVVGRKGELVCTAPFPSMPLRFWDDPDGEKYRKAYFERFPGAWHHGDFVEITERGTLVITGRSDATLNPGGVRIGTADIYRVVEQVEGVADSLVIGQQWEGDERIVLFVKPADGFSVDEGLVKLLRSEIRRRLSPRHVPAVVLEVDAVPYTISGKKVELAVRDVVHGRPVVNADALANPESLKQYEARPELER